MLLIWFVGRISGDFPYPTTESGIGEASVAHCSQVESVTDSYHEVRFSIMFSAGHTSGETVPARSGGDGKRFQVISSDEQWEDTGMDEIEDFQHMPYPAAWDRDPDDDRFEDELVDAAQAWYRAVQLLLEQGFAPEDCEAEVMRRCSRVSRGQRALERRIDQQEAEYAALAADESLCEFPWGRLCPEHGNTLSETRRGVRCGREGCERRWPTGHKRGHCDLPAVVVTDSSIKPSGEWRLCAGHRRMFPGGPVLRTLSARNGSVRDEG